MTLLSHRRNPNAEIGAGVDHQLHAAQHFGCFIAQAHAAKRGDRAAGAVACAAQLPKNMGHSLELPRAPASGRSMPRARVIAQLACSLWEPNPRSQSILGKPRPEPASAADLRPPPDGSHLGPAGCQSAELARRSLISAPQLAESACRCARYARNWRGATALDPNEPSG
jgi:hypothetical protein